MSGWVRVIGPPWAICRLNNGTMLPRLPSTFPKRTETKARPDRCAASRTMSSAMRLVAPMTLYGWTALSVEIKTNRSVPQPRAALTTVCVPRTLLLTASSTLTSIRGTCLWAAAWKTTSGRNRSKTLSMRGWSRMSAITACLGRAPAGDRAAHLQPDRSTGAGDQNAFARQAATHRLIVDGRRFTAQQVTDLDVPQAADADLASQELVDPRHGAKRDAESPAGLGGAADPPAR